MSFCTICASSSLAPRIAPNLITLNSAIAACDKAGQWEVALSLPLDYFGSGPGIWGSLIKLALSGSSFMRFWFIYKFTMVFICFYIYCYIHSFCTVGCYCSQLAVHQPEARFVPVWPPCVPHTFRAWMTRAQVCPSLELDSIWRSILAHYWNVLVRSPYSTSSKRQQEPWLNQLSS